MLRIYYTDLIELTAALVFLVVFKIVLLIGMRKMSTLLADEPAPKKIAPKLSKPLGFLRYALTILLVGDAVWQIPPSMLKVSYQALVAAGNTRAVAQWWVAHSLWLNIWSVVIELSLAGLLISFSHPIAVRISASAIALYGLIVWVFVQHFGHFATPSPSFLAASPGTGLLMVITCIPLVMQELPVPRYFRWATGVYFFLFCISLWNPFSRFWSGKGYGAFASVHPAGLPIAIGRVFHNTAVFFAHHGFAVTVVLGFVALVLGLLWLLKAAPFVAVATEVILVILWVIPEAVGLGGAFAFALGSAPIIGVWAMMPWIRKRTGVM